MAARTSSATEPATAAMGVMKQSACMRARRGPHAPGDGALRARDPTGRRSSAQLGAELVKDGGEACRRGLLGMPDIGGAPFGADDEIDRPILQVQPAAIRQHRLPACGS